VGGKRGGETSGKKKRKAGLKKKREAKSRCRKGNHCFNMIGKRNDILVGARGKGEEGRLSRREKPALEKRRISKRKNVAYLLSKEKKKPRMSLGEVQRPSSGKRKARQGREKGEVYDRVGNSAIPPFCQREPSRGKGEAQDSRRWSKVSAKRHGEDARYVLDLEEKTPPDRGRPRGEVYPPPRRAQTTL